MTKKTKNPAHTASHPCFGRGGLEKHVTRVLMVRTKVAVGGMSDVGSLATLQGASGLRWWVTMLHFFLLTQEYANCISNSHGVQAKIIKMAPTFIGDADGDVGACCIGTSPSA